jgi:hypothetical protein
VDGWDSPPLDFNVVVWVGFIACFGTATETGIITLVYLREAIEKAAVWRTPAAPSLPPSTTSTDRPDRSFFGKVVRGAT